MARMGKLVESILRGLTIVATAGVLTWTGFDPHVIQDTKPADSAVASSTEARPSRDELSITPPVDSTLHYHPPGRIGAKRNPDFVAVDRNDGIDPTAIVSLSDPPPTPPLEHDLLVLAVRARPPPG